MTTTEYRAFRKMMNKVLAPIFLKHKNNLYMCETSDGIYLTTSPYPTVGRDKLPFYEVLIIH